MKTALLLLLALVASLLAVSAAACTAAAPASTVTPTLDTAHWKVYQDLNHHFSFEYPKAYDDRSLCALKVKQSDLSSPDFSVSMSSSNLKITLSPLENPKETDPQSAVDALRNLLGQAYQVSLDDPVKRTVAGLPALSQRYRTAYVKDGYLENTYFIKNGTLYTIALNTPSNCDGYTDTPTVVEAYQRILESFRIQ